MQCKNVRAFLLRVITRVFTLRHYRISVIRDRVCDAFILISFKETSSARLKSPEIKRIITSADTKLTAISACVKPVKFVNGSDSRATPDP
jgi:hypothetical protein